MNLHKSGKNTDPINLTIKERQRKSELNVFCSKVVIAGYAIKTKKNFLLVPKKLRGKF
jgi:hypothetical protein